MSTETTNDEVSALANDMLAAAKGRKLSDVSVAACIIIADNIVAVAADWFDAMEAAIYGASTVIRLTGARWFAAHNGIERRKEPTQ